MQDIQFRKVVLDYWRRSGRHELPWRKTTKPYHILVSEMMLQQTQVDRVIPFYRVFLRKFPTFRALSRAPVSEVLKAWQGLGYNRRALMLQRCAQEVTRNYRGHLPKTHEALCELPGIGPYTAGAVLAFAFNKSHPIIETNIRRIYLHHYFPEQSGVRDDQLMPIVERTLDRRNPRRWYSALMDYGTFLAAFVTNPNQRSRHYAKQSKFEGSLRQLRGVILREVLAGAPLEPTTLARKLKRPTAQVKMVIHALSQEGLLEV